jgi:hypothetical protein
MMTYTQAGVYILENMHPPPHPPGEEHQQGNEEWENSKEKGRKRKDNRKIEVKGI